MRQTGTSSQNLYKMRSSTVISFIAIFAFLSVTSSNAFQCPKSKVIVADGDAPNTKVYFSVAKEDLPLYEELGTVSFTEFSRHFDKSIQQCIPYLGGPCQELLNNCPILSTCRSQSFNNVAASENLDDIIQANMNKPSWRHARFFDRLGTCGCEDTENFIPNSDLTTCIPNTSSPKFGEKCDATSTCNFPGMTCRRNKCACTKDDKEQEYDSEREICADIVDAECSPSSSTQARDSCVRNANCQQGRCKCNQGFVELNNRCYASYSDKCEKTTDCSPNMFLKCIDGHCECEDPVNQIPTGIGYQQQECRSGVGFSCSLDGNILPKCVEMAECYNGTCKCMRPYAKTPESKCRRQSRFGEPCIPNGCDFRNGLACIDGSCKCFAPQLKYKNGACLAVEEGASCGNMGPLKADYVDPAIEYYSVQCDSKLKLRCGGFPGELTSCQKF